MSGTTVMQTAMPKARLKAERRVAIATLATMRSRLANGKFPQRVRETMEREILLQKRRVTWLQNATFNDMMSPIWRQRIEKGREAHPYFGPKA